MRPYYADEWVTLYCGDCRELLPSLDGDCFITDPPYGVELAARSTKRAVRPGSYTAFADTPEYVQEVAVPVVRALIRQTVAGAVTPGERCLWSYPKPAAMGVIWSPAGAGPSSWGFRCTQTILYYGKDPYLARGKGSRPDSVAWNNATEENGHPCPKPIQVMRWIVNRVSWSGQTILDPFAGSGTTLRAAKDLNRHAIGIEIEERYCEMAAQRLAQEVLDLEIAA